MQNILEIAVGSFFGMSVSIYCATLMHSWLGEQEKKRKMDEAARIREIQQYT